MPQVRSFTVKIPTRFRMPRFGVGNFYRQTPQTAFPLTGLGNFYRSVGQFYRQSSAYLPTAINSDLTTHCPAAAAGHACPAASPGQRSCPAKATGRACPVQSASYTLRKTFPSFGMSGLGAYSGNYYTDPASEFSVEQTGTDPSSGLYIATIFDSAGDTIYQSGSSGLNQNYGPFSVDGNGNIYQAGTLIWDPMGGFSGTNPSAAALGTSAAPTVATGTKAAMPTVLPSPGSRFFAAPAGYAQPAPAPPVQSASWFDKTTTLFGMTLKNSDLLLGGGIGALLLAMSARKKR